MKKQAALRLVDTRTIDRRQWLGVRKGGIGSSDAAAAVGLNPYKSPLELWLEKTGRVEVVEQREDMEAATYWGTLLEPLVAAAYTAKTGNKVRRLNAVLQHPSFPYLLANIDREVIGQTGVQILECKTAGEFGSRLWKDGVPEYVQLQVQHQLAVTGKQAADVAVLLCGQKLEIHRIERDEALIARLIVLETRFWDMVEQDIDPPRMVQPLPPVRCASCTGATIRAWTSRPTRRSTSSSRRWWPSMPSSMPRGNWLSSSSKPSSKRSAMPPRRCSAPAR